MNFENFKNFHIKMRKKEKKKDFGPLGRFYYFFPTNFFLYPTKFFSHMAQKVWAKEILGAFTLEAFDVRVFDIKILLDA